MNRKADERITRYVRERRLERIAKILRWLFMARGMK